MNMQIKSGIHLQFSPQFKMYCSIASIVICVFLLAYGLILIKKAKGKRIAGWGCIGVGALGIISNLVQILTKIMG